MQIWMITSLLASKKKSPYPKLMYTMFLPTIHLMHVHDVREVLARIHVQIICCILHERNWIEHAMLYVLLPATSAVKVLESVPSLCVGGGHCGGYVVLHCSGLCVSKWHHFRSIKKLDAFKYIRTCWINPLCRSMPINKDQISGIDPNKDHCRSIWYKSKKKNLNLKKIWSLLIGIDRHRGLIQNVLIYAEKRICRVSKAPVPLRQPLQPNVPRSH